MDACPECGFMYGALSRADLVDAIGDVGRQMAGSLRGPPARLARRRQPGVWSALEYACHVRDVLLVLRDRLFVALVEEEPSFKPMYRDERVALDHYDQQVPDVAAAQLLMGAAMLAHALHGLDDDQWSRSLLYGYPGPMRRDVEWMAHHALHEMVHQLADLEGQLAS
jgi:hypothetical protein